MVCKRNYAYLFINPVATSTKVVSNCMRYNTAPIMHDAVRWRAISIEQPFSTKKLTWMNIKCIVKWASDVIDSFILHSNFSNHNRHSDGSNSSRNNDNTFSHHEIIISRARTHTQTVCSWTNERVKYTHASTVSMAIDMRYIIRIHCSTLLHLNSQWIINWHMVGMGGDGTRDTERYKWKKGAVIAPY